ncbi:MAG: hypothetical protein BRC47_00155 [Cyanobacteria bacterium QS_7_48_42]|nr:MAG: hypothetical protein BRC36_18015 [Cyanobacteria bacterium QH_2_48_84]PSO67291.1 MAG: hypothetical protein BRC39_01790 [Cyanobacteria bacterium QH_7_48_89]PSO71474.1 MAG: hypothetical protein BRC42_07955 [Cyanobacteria bacterium QS_1_48_34]PSO72080.1 MAG: hypothetical protein BRC37_12500 [Cyanobacteria bacterium QH_3_48_40]PSO78224.1 MAG: hypothetical protein BRC44_11515 [Cyanobacteria bacterium QS_4_48_99]PSO85209.1 MAG: hypothetical protein BRC45_04470 [Cyanobacteria bacterium QS_5_48
MLEREHATPKQGTVWFAMINVGKDADQFSAEQEVLRQSLLNEWGSVPSLPPTKSEISRSKRF